MNIPEFERRLAAGHVPSNVEMHAYSQQKATAEFFGGPLDGVVRPAVQLGDVGLRMGIKVPTGRGRWRALYLLGSVAKPAYFFEGWVRA